MTSGLSLVLVRHGETEWMERGRLHGRLDSPLSPTGRRHAEQAAQRLHRERFDALYTSPLGRAMETAAILRRVTQALEWIVAHHPSGRLLVVAHHAVLSRLLGVMMAAPENAWRD